MLVNSCLAGCGLRTLGRGLLVTVFASMLSAAAAVAAPGAAPNGAQRGYFGWTWELTPEGTAVLVTEVPGGPAQRAGVRVGDSVVAFNGAGFKFDSNLAMLRGLEWVRPGVPVELALVRAGKNLKIILVPDPFPTADAAALAHWTEQAEQSELLRRRRCAMSTFRDLAAYPGIDVRFKKGPGDPPFTMSSNRQLPADLDLPGPFVRKLIAGLRGEDELTVHYTVKEGKLEMLVRTVPEYLDAKQIAKQANALSDPN